MIGIISHMKAMKERIPAQIMVEGLGIRGWLCSGEERVRAKSMR